MEETLTLTHATERDVDLLLVEELKCSIEFVQWFLSRLGKPWAAGASYQVLHSRRRVHNRREIDITLQIEAGSERTILLIENKLDTTEQPQQAESYQEEIGHHLSHGAADACAVLVAPAGYLEKNSAFAGKFDNAVSYEEIASFLIQRGAQQRGELAARLRHRAGLLSQAITKARRGYVAVPVPGIEDFNAQYRELMIKAGSALLPGRAMTGPRRPGESKTMIFAPETLPTWDFLPQIRIVHQLREGNANISFYGWGNYFNQLAAIMGPTLSSTRYYIVPTVNKRVGGNSGLMLVADTPPVDNLRSFEDQRTAIFTGIETAGGLRNWFWSNRAVIEKWANAVEKLSRRPE